MYHIVPQVALAADISDNLELNTLVGAKMYLNVYDVLEYSGILFDQTSKTVS